MSNKNPRILPPQDYLLELFRYDEGKGLLIWRHNRGASHVAGKIAGHIDPLGYRSICVDGVQYMAHRLIWRLTCGQSPPQQMDHINHNRSDNRISNLRVATPSENSHNRKLYLTNSSGACGVSMHRATKKWHAYIRANGRRVNLGFFDKKIDAIAARQSAETKYGYHPNHGR